MRKCFPYYRRRPLNSVLQKPSLTCGAQPGRTRAQAQSGVLAAPPPQPRAPTGVRNRCPPQLPPRRGAARPPTASGLGCQEAVGRPSGPGPAPPLTSEGRLVSLGRRQLQVPGHRQGVPRSPARTAFPGLLCHRSMRAPRRRRGLNGPMSAGEGGAWPRGAGPSRSL